MAVLGKSVLILVASIFKPNLLIADSRNQGDLNTNTVKSWKMGEGKLSCSDLSYKNQMEKGQCTQQSDQFTRKKWLTEYKFVYINMVKPN